jgi:preprotein translocase subunit SecD
MKVCARRFNSFLAAALALALLGGCQTTDRNKDVSALRVHMETNVNDAGTSRTVSVLRADPLLVTINTTPILTEANIVAATVISTPGGFAIQIQFDENARWILEQYSAANPGRHFVIFGQWGPDAADARWLAAPLITRRISNGVLSFTPDMSRQEANRFVLGLNAVAKKFRKGQLK